MGRVSLLVVLTALLVGCGDDDETLNEWMLGTYQGYAHATDPIIHCFGVGTMVVSAADAEEIRGTWIYTDTTNSEYTTNCPTLPSSGTFVGRLDEPGPHPPHAVGVRVDFYEDGEALPGVIEPDSLIARALRGSYYLEIHGARQ